LHILILCSSTPDFDFDFRGRREAAHKVRSLTRNVPEFDHRSVSEHAVCEARLYCVFVKGHEGTAKQGEAARRVNAHTGGRGF